MIIIKKKLLILGALGASALGINTQKANAATVNGTNVAMVKRTVNSNCGVSVFTDYKNAGYTGELLRAGDEVNVYDTKTDIAGNKWIKIGQDQWIMEQYTVQSDSNDSNSTQYESSSTGQSSLTQYGSSSTSQSSSTQYQSGSTGQSSLTQYGSSSTSQSSSTQYQSGSTGQSNSTQYGSNSTGQSSSTQYGSSSTSQSGLNQYKSSSTSQSGSTQYRSSSTSQSGSTQYGSGSTSQSGSTGQSNSTQYRSSSTSQSGSTGQSGLTQYRSNSTGQSNSTQYRSNSTGQSGSTQYRSSSISQSGSTVVSQRPQRLAQTQKTPANTVLSQSENSAKEWIAQHESGGSYTAQNGQYYGRYQLSRSYLNNDYSSENQEKAANNYVKNRYGSWSNAKRFWQTHGWY